MIPLLPIALLLITTGNATSESVVNTKVEGASATVETRIYTNVNGNESTVTGNTAGETRVVNDGTTVTVTTPSVSPFSTPAAEGAAQPETSSVFRRFIESLAKWLTDLFGNKSAAQTVLD